MGLYTCNSRNKDNVWVNGDRGLHFIVPACYGADSIVLDKPEAFKLWTGRPSIDVLFDSNYCWVENGDKEIIWSSTSAKGLLHPEGFSPTAQPIWAQSGASHAPHASVPTSNVPMTTCSAFQFFSIVGAHMWTEPCYHLFHQTDEACADSIRSSGQLRPGSVGDAGGGIYCADSIPATDAKALRKGWIVECFVCLGTPKLTDGKQCSNWDLQSLAKEGCQSVIIQGRQDGTEYVVYHPSCVKVVAINPRNCYK